jgi:riboflavin synthase alpha subunit
MATASAVVSRRGNDQFRGLFSDTWAVRCTLDAGSLVDGAGETDDVTVAGVALGDMVIGASLGVDLVGLTVTGYVSAANTVKFRIQNESESTVNLDSAKLRIVIVRMV